MSMGHLLVEEHADVEAEGFCFTLLTSHFPGNRSYKPTLDQLPLTRMIDLATLRAAGVPCFGTLERALRFVGLNIGSQGVYPSP